MSKKETVIEFKEIKAGPTQELDEIFKDRILMSENMVNSIKYCNDLNILVHGYRGTGKTSLIKSVTEKLDDKIIINCSLSQYKKENFGDTLHLFIRKAYQSPKIKDYSELYKEIEILNEKTYYDIKHNFYNSYEKEKNVLKNIDFSEILKNWIPILGTFIAALNIKYNFISDKVISNIVLVLVLVSINIKSEILIKRQQKYDIEKVSKSDVSILFDEFIKLLRELSEKKKLVIIIDEMDKMTQEEFDNFISDFKEMFFTDKVTFIMIIDQVKYYNIINNLDGENQVKSSIYSKYVYVPLIDDDVMTKLLEKYINENEKDFEFIRKIYMSYLWWNSKGVLRTFNNLIIQDLTVDNKGQGSLTFDENKLAYYEAFLLKNICDEYCVNLDVNVNIEMQ